MKDLWYSTKDAAQFLGVSRVTVTVKCANGRLPATWVGQGYRIRYRDLCIYKARREAGKYGENPADAGKEG